jgi:anaerobic selenocysteine-containing dehydrogenase/Fe-S-cluster-containing dehydrogenase component
VSEKKEGMERRTFLKLAGLTGAGALAGCAAPPAERIFSYVSPPDDERLGIATWYATTCQECPASCGLLVRTREGRTVKVEGNPDHPINRGTLCVRGQAQVQGLYNPDRVAGPKVRQGDGWDDLSWDEAESRLMAAVQDAVEQGGAIQFWTGASSGAWNDLVDDWCEAVGAEHIVYEPFDYAPIREASRRVFGTGTVPLADLSQARFVLSIGADFLDTWGLPMMQARGYDALHSARGGTLGKHVQVESRLSLTGHNADEWISIRPGTEAEFALGLAQLVGAGVTGYDPATVAERCGVSEEILRRLAQELLDHRPALVLGPGVTATGSNATEVWTAVFMLNRALEAIGTALQPSPGFDPGQTATYDEIRQAVQKLASGEVRTLLVHGANPVFSLANGVDFLEASTSVRHKISFSSYPDETTEICEHVLPDHHPLESWGDTEPAAGVRGLMQPTMRPVLQTQPTADVLLRNAQALGGRAAERLPDGSFREYLLRRWGGDEDAFNSALQRGGDLPEAMPATRITQRWSATVQAPPAILEGNGDLTLLLYPHPYFYDGRGANKPWLQEMPDPLTQIVWDSWCEIHPDTAARLGLENGDGATVTTAAGSVDVPVYVNSRMRTDVVAVPIGQGHTAYGRYAQERGGNAFALLGAGTDQASGGRAYLSQKARVAASGTKHRMVQTSATTDQAGRGIAQAIPLTLLAGGGQGGGHAGEHGEGGHDALVFGGYKDKPEQSDGLHAKPMDRSDLPAVGSNQYNRTDKRWGMAVDLSSCIGCNACVVACSAENNIAWVGKENIARGRAMNWIRIERYYEETAEGLETRFVPMMCQHCDSAPCEPVCPVYATYHNPEGLNVQLYNRCVGTRYCSNNCAYKVRAFNWFDYERPSPLQYQLNPDVTVRSKGVMEKCTFCRNRINIARDKARDENRDIRDGEITPACAQSCPTQAIVFGNLNDPDSEVARRSKDPRGYHVFEDLNTKPGVTYLKKVTRRTAKVAVDEEAHS